MHYWRNLQTQILLTFASVPSNYSQIETVSPSLWKHSIFLWSWLRYQKQGFTTPAREWVRLMKFRFSFAVSLVMLSKFERTDRMHIWVYIIDMKAYFLMWILHWGGQEAVTEKLFMALNKGWIPLSHSSRQRKVFLWQEGVCQGEGRSASWTSVTPGDSQGDLPGCRLQGIHQGMLCHHCSVSHVLGEQVVPRGTGTATKQVPDQLG